MNSMTCREFDEVVHGFVRVELLDVTLREDALDHAARCGNCAERMSEAAILADASEMAHRNLREQQAPARVETAVLAAFRNQHRRASWRRTFEWAAIGAAAAVVLVFLWTVADPSKGQSSPTPRKDVSSRSTGPLDAQVFTSSQAADILPVAETEEVSAATGENLPTDDFVTLPYADAIGPDDLGIVVRVQLTRASLAELGYPVADAPDPDEDLISADVLVGEDGWPRAVRLVQ
jgi:hypothetical protein